MTGNSLFYKIKKEIVELARFLHSNQISFIFNPNNIGLGENFEAKYFLEKFQLSETDNGTTLQTIEDQINSFFDNMM